MLIEDRKSNIIKILEERSSVTVAELSELLEISEVSVRKLLAAMEQNGQLKRTWGGAVSMQGSLGEFSHDEKVPRNLQEKKCIAQAAYDCINDKEAIFLDAGTTTAEIARIIRNGGKKDLVVGTNALNVAQELVGTRDISVILIGGELRYNILSCVGSLAEEELNRLFFDKGFISGDHLTIANGFTTPTLVEANIKRQMIKACKSYYCVLDSSKFGDDSLVSIAPTHQLDGLITDWRAPQKFLDELREKGVHVIQGKRNSFTMP